MHVETVGPLSCSIVFGMHVLTLLMLCSLSMRLWYIFFTVLSVLKI